MYFCRLPCLNFNLKIFLFKIQRCPPMWRGDKESVLLEGELGGAVKQHKSITALDYCFPSAQLGVSSWSGGPHARWGHRTQIPSLNGLYTEDSVFLPLTPPPSRLASMLRLKSSLELRPHPYPLMDSSWSGALFVFNLLLNNHVSKPFYWLNSPIPAYQLWVLVVT